MRLGWESYQSESEGPGLKPLIRYRERAFGTRETVKSMCTGIKVGEQGTVEGTSGRLVHSAGRETVEGVKVQANKHMKRCSTSLIRLMKCTFRTQ